MEEYQIEWYKRIGDKFSNILGICRYSNYNKLKLLADRLIDNGYYVDFWKVCPYCHETYSFKARICPCQCINFMYCEICK